VWTPKRILLLFGGLALFAACYGIYAFFLGGIDGLPPLPEQYRQDPTVEVHDLPIQPPADVDKKLRQSFGAECPELKWSIKTEFAKKGLVFATEDFTILDDGRVKLVPFSLAIYNKNHADGGFPEINTVRSAEAYITFDQPIKNLVEMGDRKITKAELRGAITIRNNRRTPKREDDLEVFINNGPLKYEEALKRIWSDGVIKLVDTQPHPETRVQGVGLEIQLSKDATLNGSRKKSAKTPLPVKSPNNSNVSAVETIVLKSNVDMTMYVDSRSNFLTGTQESVKVVKTDGTVESVPFGATAPAPGTKGGKKSLVNIKTPGRFTYNLTKDQAIFESPTTTAAGNAKKELILPESRVHVLRVHKLGKDNEFHDQLDCDRLELQFQKKKDTQPRRASGDQGSDREIDSARATAVPGKTVRLVLDSENMTAEGVEMIYHRPTDQRGAETIIRGDPMKAGKDGHKIRAQEMQLVAANAKGKGQFAIAKGNVQIDLVDHSTNAEKQVYHALCDDTLVVTKTQEGNTELDLLTFKTNAAFIDDVGKQKMCGDTLMVWVEPAEHRRNPDQVQTGKDEKADNAPRQQPRKLEAIGNVTITSGDLILRKCHHLLVRFRNGPGSQLPDSLPDTADAAPGTGGDAPPGGAVHLSLLTPDPNAPPGNVSTPALPAPPTTSGPKTGTANKQKDREPHAPIELEADDVSAYVLRTGAKNELEEVVAVDHNGLHVHQEGAEPKVKGQPREKGIDITGDTLHLTHDPQGDVLIVLADNRDTTVTRKMARMQLKELILVGPRITINQKDNTATVDGVGTMDLPSNTTFDGGPPAKPGARLTVQWTKDMFFNGQDAFFRGNVSATQEGAKLLCLNLHVSLDRKVSLKQGQNKSQTPAQEQDAGPKVERVVCSNQVDLQEIKNDAAGHFVRFDRLVGSELTADNRNGPVNAAGPGRVFLLEYGSPDLQPQAKPAANSAKQLYLTRVDFTGRMWSNKYQDGRRKAMFFNDVEVYHLPSNNPNIAVNPNQLPKNGLYLSCGQLTVQSTPAPGNKAYQAMQGQINVFLRTPEYLGRSEVLHYNETENQELIILEGKVGNPARLTKIRGNGVQGDTVEGMRILYNRRTGQVSLDGGNVIQGSGR
jgi:hypothetical protein